MYKQRLRETEATQSTGAWGVGGGIKKDKKNYKPEILFRDIL